MTINKRAACVAVISGIAMFTFACSGVSSEDKDLQKFEGKKDVSEVVKLPAASPWREAVIERELTSSTQKRSGGGRGNINLN